MFETLTDANFRETMAATEGGVLICFKQNCPHCKNMEKVLEKFSKKAEGVKLFKLDSEANPEALAELDAERAPTVCVIKNGAVAARKSGLMNPKEMLAFYKGA